MGIITTKITVYSNQKGDLRDKHCLSFSLCSTGGWQTEKNSTQPQWWKSWSLPRRLPLRYHNWLWPECDLWFGLQSHSNCSWKLQRQNMWTVWQFQWQQDRRIRATWWKIEQEHQDLRSSLERAGVGGGLWWRLQWRPVPQMWQHTEGNLWERLRIPQKYYWCLCCLPEATKSWVLLQRLCLWRVHVQGRPQSSLPKHYGVRDWLSGHWSYYWQVEDGWILP